MSKKGFSLIEITITIGIIGVIGVFLSYIFANTFKGNTKSTLLSTIKQNGQTSIGILEQAIRDSDTVVCPSATSTNSPSLTLRRKDGVIVRFKMYPELPTRLKNGNFERDFPAFNNTQQNPTTACTELDNTAAVTPAQLFDTNTSSGVSLISGGFNVTKISGYKDVVTVQFNLGPGVATPTGTENTLGGNGSILFSTTIQLR